MGDRPSPILGCCCDLVFLATTESIQAAMDAVPAPIQTIFDTLAAVI
jgi:hypothetical protein